MRVGKVLCVIGGFAAGPLYADTLDGASNLLCAPGYVTHCSSGGECETGPSVNYNIPSFLRIDLDLGTLRTTEASGMALDTKVEHMTRVNGQIYLQGVENGRAYSIVITEATGTLALTVASEGETAAAFGACTPD